MHINTLECSCCGKILDVETEKQEPDFLDVAGPAYSLDWRMSRGKWFCGRACAIEDADDLQEPI